MRSHHWPGSLVVSRRDVLRFGSAAGVALGLSAHNHQSSGTTDSSMAAASGKTASTYYTEEKVANARANVEQYPWAAQLRDDAVDAAQEFVGHSDEFLWDLVPGQGVPRSLGVLIRYRQRIKGSPGPEGSDINQYGAYPWLIDVVDDPWKLSSPVTGERYPSNDFASFYQAGLNEHGVFDRELALAEGSQYLVNELYPDRGEGWGVDDGSGWADDDGDIWTFVAYYNHWAMWAAGGGQDFHGYLPRALNALRDAYLYTGQSQYAHKGLVLLDRIADLYPDMDISAYPWDEGFDNGDPDIHTAQGNVLHDIWETSLVRSLVFAYDAFYPAIAEDPELLEFLQAQAQAHQLPFDKSTPQALRAHIEDRILREVYPAVRNSRLRGNQGMHQGVLSLAAVVLDEEQTSREWLDFTFQAGELVEIEDPDAPYGRRYELTGGDVGRLMIDDVDRDGWGYEGAPAYNTGWTSNFLSMARAIDGYERYPEFDLFGHVKFLSMLTAYPGIIMLERYTPSIGDSGVTGEPNLVGIIDLDLLGFERTGDRSLAHIAYLRNGRSTEGLHGDVFSSEPGDLARQIEDVIAEDGEFDPGNTHQPGFGFAGLRAGSGPDAHALWMYYGRTMWHGHRDALNIGLYGAGMDLSPDLGYPESTGTDPERLNWTSATVSHNTVVVDGRSQNAQWVSTPTLIGETDRVRVIEVQADDVYPDTDLYRRTSAMVSIDDTRSYVVDVFRVSGGQEHVFSFHGGPGSVSTAGLELQEQDGGSYAGPDVPFQDPDYNEGGHRSGFNYLNNVERDPSPAATFDVDWAVQDNWGVHDTDPEAKLRLSMLSGTGDVALADGIPPRNQPGNPARLRYLLARRRGEWLTSGFISVIQPYRGDQEPVVAEPVPVRATDGQPVGQFDVSAVRVSLPDGRIDYVISARDGSATYVVDDAVEFSGRFAVLSMRGGDSEYRYTLAATRLGQVDDGGSATMARLRGRVLRFTRELSEQNQLEVHFDDELARDPAALPDLVGTHVHVQTDGERNGVYRIHGIAQERRGALRYRLDLGAQTLIRGLIDPEDLDGGYRYNIRGGAPFSIPVGVEQTG